MNTKILERIGFTEGEIKVYFALLELGNSTSGPIITRASIARSKVYEILEKLKKKGLVSEVIKENTKYFQAASPERIMDYINSKEKELQEEKIEFKEILPQLIKQQKFAEEKQEVRVYVGYEGMKTFFDELLSQMEQEDEYLAMTFTDKSWEDPRLYRFYLKFHQKRAEKKCKAKIIYNSKYEQSKNKLDFSNTGFYQIRSSDIELPVGIAIFRDIVATVNWGKTPRVFAIVCKENAEQYRKFFYDVWKKQNKQ